MRREGNKRGDDIETGSPPGDGGDTDGTRVVLWTRRPVCGPRTEIIDRLSSLRARGQIDDFTVQTWPDEVAISEHTRHSRVIENYERFRSWAEETEVTIIPPFDRRTVSTLVGRSEEVLTLPVLCLAIYEDGLCGVYPCTDGDETLTVTDYVDACAGGDTTPSPGDLAAAAE
jgi:hypothetical protein